MQTLSWLGWVLVTGVMAMIAGQALGEAQTPRARHPLDPRGEIHLPIGIANTVDTLKTFVEAEGCFSPGVGSYGIYCWLYDPVESKLWAPTMDEAECEHGLTDGYLIPWAAWKAAGIEVKTEVCEVARTSPAGEVLVVAVRVRLANTDGRQRRVSLYVALRPLGPAGWAVRELSVTEAGDGLLVDGHTALVVGRDTGKPEAAGVVATDTVGDLALDGELPTGRQAASATGDCSGALRFELSVEAGTTTTLGFICPVLPGRRAVRHQWDGVSEWAQLDLAEPNPVEDGILQPDPGLDWYRKLSTGELFAEAYAYWAGLVGRVSIDVPDPRWSECFSAIIGHAAMSMNEGAPDVAVVNYNVFNRDGVYVANILQKSGRFDLARAAIDYFLAHPFNGRVYPEADNPGQILWVMAQHWLFTRDGEWLQRVYPAVRELAAMIGYYRTTDGPHWVSPTSLDFGKALPVAQRQELEPGRCDGHHPEYTEAFDIAGLQGAALLAEAMEEAGDAEAWVHLAGSLWGSYDESFGADLGRGYGSYCVLWPCRLYPLSEGKAFERFNSVGARKPNGWRYFPLATAHQGLLAGNSAAGHGTLEAHRDHPQMQGWYALDEGGKSGPGGWHHLRTTWPHNVAMPHGWAIAELWLLLRDALVFEDEDRLVLLAGVPEAWFTSESGMRVRGLPTHFGSCSFSYAPTPQGATLELTGEATPPGGYVLRLPKSLKAKVVVGGMPQRSPNVGDIFLPRGARRVELALTD